MTQRIKAICVGRLLGVADCYVFDGGVRALSEAGVVRLLTGSATKPKGLGVYLERLPSRYAHLAARPNIEFVLPGGRVGHAVDVEAIAEICQAYAEADLAGELRADQRHLARGATRLILAAFKRGLREEIDVATGYDAIRQRNELSVLFGEELTAWDEVFSQALIQRLCALGFAGEANAGWSGGRPPQPLAATFRRIYDVILGAAAGRELKTRNPDPKFKSNHHQLLTPEARALLKDNMRIVAFAAEQSNSAAEFMGRLRAHYGRQPSLVLAA